MTATITKNEQRTEARDNSERQVEVTRTDAAITKYILSWPRRSVLCERIKYYELRLTKNTDLTLFYGLFLATTP